jgi:hypothetical protein
VSLTLPLKPRSSEKEMSAHSRESALVLLLLRELLHCENLYTRGVSYAGRCKLNRHAPALLTVRWLALPKLIV